MFSKVLDKMTYYCLRRFLAAFMTDQRPLCLITDLNTRPTECAVCVPVRHDGRPSEVCRPPLPHLMASQQLDAMRPLTCSKFPSTFLYFCSRSDFHYLRFQRTLLARFLSRHHQIKPPSQCIEPVICVVCIFFFNGRLTVFL